MSSAAQITASTELKTVFAGLHAFETSVQGPFAARKQNRIYLVDGCILKETEIVTLHKDRRRSERVMLELNLLVRLETSQGRPLQTHAFTVIVNANGGQLRSPFRMAADQKITLVNPGTGKAVECRVVGVVDTAEGDYLVSFAFGQPDPSFWPMSHSGRVRAES